MHQFKLYFQPVAVAEKRLMDVKLGELGTWIGRRDFTPNGLIAAVRRGKEPKANSRKRVARVVFKMLTMWKKPP